VSEWTRRLVAGALIYTATAIRFYFEKRTAKRPMVKVQSLPIARGAASISSKAWFLLLMFTPLPLIPLDDIPLPHGWRVPLQIAGGVILAGSVGLFYWCHVALGEFWYGEPGLKREHELIQVGPYRRIRHPMYTSFFLGYVGSLLLLQGWAYVFPFICAPGFYVMTVVEEKILTEQFGDRYVSYRKVAGRFLPRLFPRA
jgi:protein-S-isoprenylcysteine O-methyltransferase Ste14